MSTLNRLRTEPLLSASNPKIIVIAGPTASGKSEVGVRLALALQGEIVNADSMQVYRGMDIGTAKPSMEERKGIPHHLLDVVNPDEEFNAALYRSFCLPIINDMAARRKPCFVVGGTGLYIRSLLHGLFPCPSRDPQLRSHLEQEWRMAGPDLVYERLRCADPLTAKRIHSHDRIRIIRALEILHVTGKRPSDLFEVQRSRQSPLKALKICLGVDRQKLYERIHERSLAMVEAGLAQETEGLLTQGYSPGLRSMQSIGYRHMVRYLEGTWSLDEAISWLQKDTRRYAKRQMTWFRQDPGLLWIDPMDLRRIQKEVEGYLLGMP